MKQPGLIPPSRADADALDARSLLSAVIQRQAKTILGLIGAVVALSFAIAAMLPLKEQIPYVVEVNKTTGEVVTPAQQTAEKYNPTDDSINFFIRRWINAEFTIQSQLARQNEAMALSMFRGEVAINKHSDFRAKDQTFGRLANEPTLSRAVSIDSLVPVAGAKRSFVANLTLTTTSRGATVAQRKLLTIYYEILPPKSKEDRMQHPIGLYIVDFSIADITN